MESPATKRVVSFLKKRKRVAKSFNPSRSDNQSSESLVIIYFSPLSGPSLWYPWRRLSPPSQGGAFAHEHQNEEPARMRLKLVIAASVLAAVVGAGGAQTLSDEQLRAICSEAKSLGLRTLVHAISAQSVRAATLAGC